MLTWDSRNLARLLAMVIIFGFSFTIRTYAQVVGATISGTVSDSSKAAIPNVQITVTDMGRGVTRTATTDSDGFYSMPNLVPSTYQLSAIAQGFATTTQSNITLTVGEKQTLNITMTVGEISQKVEVTTEAPNVELTSSSLSGEITTAAVVGLPLNGRDWTTLATLEPAVHSIPSQFQAGANSNRGNRGYGAQLSISGTRPQLNNYRLDGISIVDYAGGAPGSVLGVALGVEAIAEFSVVTANYSAEYGRTSGGVINAVTKSGTNSIHGDAFWFLRDEGLDAENFFDPYGKPNPGFHRNQFGGSVGGPIQKDKMFFFLDYEGIRQNQANPIAVKVPSSNARNGILNFSSASAFPTGCTSTGVTGTINGSAFAQCQLTVPQQIIPFLQFYPIVPGATPLALGNTLGYTNLTSNVNVANFGTARFDRRFSDKDTLAGTYFNDQGVTETPDAFNNEVVGYVSSRQMISLEETHTFSPTLVNSVRAGLSRVNVINQTITSILNPAVNNTSLGSFMGQPPSQIIDSELTTFAGGSGGLSTGTTIWNSIQAYDDAFLTKGVHSLKFGFAVERMQENTGGSGFYPNGQTTFPSLVALLQDAPSQFQAAVPGATLTTGRRQTLFGGYVQDDWQWRPNLTFNLGLRYEMVTTPTDTMGRLSVLQTPGSPTPHLGSPVYNNSTLRNFEPRVGLAWDPFHDGKTAVRAAFGIFDALPLMYESNTVVTNYPFGLTQTAKNLPLGSFPAGVAGAAGTVPPLTKQRFGFLEQNPHRNYVMIWNLNIQHQLNADTTVTVGYVGNHGVHMINRTDDINDILPATTPIGLLWPTVPSRTNLINPNVGDIRGDFWSGDSEYDALEVSLVKRLSHNLQAQVSYTWSKGIDTGSASVLGDPFTNSVPSLFWFCYSCRRGLSDFNIAHNVSINYLWNIPGPHSMGVVASHLLGGWQLGGVITAETGIPFTPLISGDPLGLDSTDPYAFPNRTKGGACDTATNPGNVGNYINLSCFTLPAAPAAYASQCNTFSSAAAPAPNGQVYCANLNGNASRNSIIGPGIFEWDASIYKNNYFPAISETFNAQFRVELFNVLNHPNLGFLAPVSSEGILFSQAGAAVGGAGALDVTTTSARQIQLALKVIW